MKYGIEQLKKLEAFTDIDRHIASYLSSIEGGGSGLFFLMVMLLSRSIDKGDVCLAIDRLADKNLSGLSPEDPDNAKFYEDITLPSAEEIIACIKKSSAAGTGDDRLPLILSENRLYFHRYMVYEDELAAMINSLCHDTDDLPPENELIALFRKYFPLSGTGHDMQAIAAAVSLRKRISVISGGPGTGKTSTVVRILRLITEARRMKGLDTAAALTAPTGKAAARLAAAFNDSSGDSGMAEPPSFTIHRFLGYSWSSGFRHGSDNPVDYDVVVADESSMADLPLMHSFFSALKPGARLILLGDRDQLASVEGGAVFGDICGSGITGYSSDMARWCSKVTGSGFAAVQDPGPGIRDSLAFLTKSWRFGPESGIGALASAVKSGSGDEVMGILLSGGFADLEFVKSAEVNAVINSAAGKYIKTDNSPFMAVTEFTGSFCILTATRKGYAGMERMNHAAERALAGRGAIDPSSEFYEGRPVMVTGNDYALQLFNGDIGIVAHSPSGGEAVFRAPDGTDRRVRCSRLPLHETAFAMTVHKSQGSEFDEVLIVLPDSWGPLMSRELLYTAVTRGRKKVTLAGSEAVIRRMVGSGLERMSGLKKKVHG